MNPIIKNHIIAQLEALPNNELQHLCDSLGVKDNDDLDLLSERLEDDVFTASLKGISIKREVGVCDYIIEKLETLDAEEAREIIDNYIGLMDDKYSEYNDSTIIICNYEKLLC